MTMTDAPFTCPHCGTVSHNPTDTKLRYCGRCHAFVDDPTISTKWQRYIPNDTVVHFDALVAVVSAGARGKVIRSQYLSGGELFAVLPPLPAKRNPQRSPDPEGEDDDGHQ